MAKSLVDGETREIKASADHSMHKHRGFKVEAERYDCDTPYVHLTLINEGWDHERNCMTSTAFERSMTDSETRDLINRLQRALSVLPTSK